MAPDASHIERLCSIFDVTPNYFFTDEDTSDASQGQRLVQMVREGMGDHAADMLMAFVELSPFLQGVLLGQARGMMAHHEPDTTERRQENSPTELVPDPRSKSGGMIERGLLEKAEGGKVSVQKERRPSSRHGR